MIDIQTVLTYLTLISVPVGVFYHIMTLNNTRKNQQMQLETRQTQLFMNVYNTWISKQKEFNTVIHLWHYNDLDDFESKYGEVADLEAHAVWDQTTMWLEGVGVLLRQGLVSMDLIFSMQSFAATVLFFWIKYEPWLVEYRERRNVPEMLHDLEYFCVELKRRYLKEYPDSFVSSLLDKPSELETHLKQKHHTKDL